jgi:acetyl esterase/lipase
MVSGGWESWHGAFDASAVRPLLDRGYTVFAVVHSSQPKFDITEILSNIHRALRFIRYHAARYGVKPDQLGIAGASAGAHLSLMMGVTGAKGDPNAKEMIDRVSSSVRAVACFHPPTDFLNYSKPDEDAVGVGLLENLKPAFGPRSATSEGRQKLGREISPIYFVHSNQPPMLIIHGDADKQVPIYQAERFVARSTQAGANAMLVVREGKGHGWPDMVNDEELFADWFDEHLRGLKPSKR